MTNTLASTEELKFRAKQGDLQALQHLRESGYFARQRAIRSGFALSPAQRRLWVLDQMLVEKNVYNVPLATRLDGPLNVKNLRRALETILQRHESLRTRFGIVEGEVRQFVSEPGRLDFEEVDAALTSEDEVKRLCRHAASRVFDLQSGPLFRAFLFKLAPERHILVLVTHHIVSDLLSVAILCRELASVYNALANGPAGSLPPLQAQYKEYAIWQNQRLSGDEGERLRGYWLRKLAGDLPIVDLPADHLRPRVKTFRADSAIGRFDRRLLSQLDGLRRQRGATLFTALMALVKVLIHRYTGATDIIVGAADGGRDQIDLEVQVGFYVNTVPLRTTFSSSNSFIEVLEKVAGTLLEAMEHRGYPFDQLISDLKLDRDTSRSPLFDISLQSHSLDTSGVELNGIRATEFDTGFRVAKFDLSFDFVEEDGELSFSVEFDTALFERERIERLVAHLRALAAAAVADPHKPIGLLEFLTDAEQRKIFNDFNPLARTDNDASTIADLFETQVRATPENTAVILGGTQIDYRELNRRANQLASLLRGRGVGPEVRVGVFMGRSVEAIVAIIAILKAGGVYVPIDPLLPPQRIAVIVEDCKPVLILSHQSLQGARPDDLCELICVDSAAAMIASQPEADQRSTLTAASAAYVIYTSGSTGAPKGVVVEHRGYVNMIRSMMTGLAIVPADRCMAFANSSFDASIYEIFLALFSGAALVLVPREVIEDVISFQTYACAHRVTVALLPPSFLSALNPESLQGFRVVVSGGETAPPSVVRRYAKMLRCINAYGPTETSVVSHWFEVRAAEDYPFGVPIGRPLRNTRSYILDETMRLRPIGVRGEIYIGGTGLARGYLNCAGMTAERFVPDPYSATPGARIYSTGDLGRYRSDGAIELFGRTDSQIKLRGYRIELGEIEAALGRHAAVQQAAVILREDQPGNRRLVAYVVSSPPATFSAVALRAHLARQLPEYMVPATIVEIPSLPFNVSGKVERSALPPPADFAREEAFVEARTELERVLAGVYAKLLGLEGVGVRDSFFSLGGNSLLAMQAVWRIRELLRIEASTVLLFEAPTIEELALRLIDQHDDPEQLERIAATINKLDSLSEEEKASLLRRAKERTAGAIE
jgi:amino acid adenylation domain-containing protein